MLGIYRDIVNHYHMFSCVDYYVEILLIVLHVTSASHSFPYVKKRILVVYHKEEELSPIEVAVEDMKAKVAELTEVVCQRTPDIKRLQLKLQGAVSVQVHAGPVAYAVVFLSKQGMQKWHHNKIGALKELFRYAMCTTNNSLCDTETVFAAHRMGGCSIMFFYLSIQLCMHSMT